MAVIIERWDILDWHPVVSDDIFVIEQYESQTSFPGEFLLRF